MSIKWFRNLINYPPALPPRPEQERERSFVTERPARIVNPEEKLLEERLPDLEKRELEERLLFLEKRLKLKKGSSPIRKKMLHEKKLIKERLLEIGSPSRKKRSVGSKERYLPNPVGTIGSGYENVSRSRSSQALGKKMEKEIRKTEYRSQRSNSRSRSEKFKREDSARQRELSQLEELAGLRKTIRSNQPYNLSDLESRLGISRSRSKSRSPPRAAPRAAPGNRALVQTEQCQNLNRQGADIKISVYVDGKKCQVN